MKKSITLTTTAFLAVIMFSVPSAEAEPEGACKACHNFTADHKMGPGLAGVFGRKAGSTDFAKYSASMKNGGWEWNRENLRTFLSNPKQGIKTLTGDDSAKTTMSYKVSSGKVDAVIDFLEGLK